MKNKSKHVNELLADGLDLHRATRLREAVQAYKRVLALDPLCRDAREFLSIALQGLGRTQDACSEIRRVVALGGNQARTFVHAAFIFLQAEQFSEAEKFARMAKEIEKYNLHASINLAFALSGQGRVVEAFSEIEELGDPVFLPSDIKFQLGQFYLARSAYKEAQPFFEYCIQEGHQANKANINLAVCLIYQRRFDEAKYFLARVTSSDLDDRGNVLQNLGVIAGARRDHRQAQAYLRESLEVMPDNHKALVNLALSLNDEARYDEALEVLYKASRMPTASRQPFLSGRLLHQKMQCADWSGYTQMKERLERDLRQGKPVAEPFGAQAYLEDPKALHDVAVKFSSDLFGRAQGNSSPTGFPQSLLPAARGLIRIAFVSGEFREHATLSLLIGLIEKLDRNKVSIRCYDNGWDDGSQLRQRLERCCEVIAISMKSDVEVVQEIRTWRCDILFNLNGFFGEVRHGLFAMQPARRQINYLGFPGTLGGECINGLVGDRVVTPIAHEKHYVEKIFRMPGCYQPTDSSRFIPTQPFIDEGVVSQGAFVYCCFNNTYKITPEIFHCWCKMLAGVPDSVLWLLETGASISDRLKKVASSYGVDPRRLVFSPRADPKRHLSRHLRADLFLDTTPYNAHTTGSDALWVGLPVLTVRGTTFPGLVGESLLRAVDLHEHLVADNLEDYVVRAINLGSDRDRTDALKSHLVINRRALRLFDTDRYCREFEDVITQIMDTLH